eukprot:scaffold14.g1195.t1
MACRTAALQLGAIKPKHRSLQPFLARSPPLRPRRRYAAARAAATSQAGQLESWLSAAGVDVGKAAVALGRGGLVTTRPVARGETMFAVPDSAWITMESVARSELGPALAGLGELEPWLAVTLLVLHERSKGAASAWAPYLAALDAAAAAALGSPLLWSEAELELLAGSQLLSSTLSYRAYFEQRFSELQGALFSGRASAGPLDPAAFTHVPTPPLPAAQAVCLVRARVHPPLEGANLALVPLADLVLLDYGVLDTARAQPGYSLALGPAPDDRFLGDKLDILEQARASTYKQYKHEGLGESTEVALTGDGRLDERLLPLLRLAGLQGPDAFLLESVFRTEVWGHVQEPVSEESEEAVCRQLADGCRAALAGYPTTIDQDLALLRAAEADPGAAAASTSGGAAVPLAPGSRGDAALRVRLGEKEALDATLQVVEQRLSQLKSFEYYAERRLKRLGLLDDQGNRKGFDGFFVDSIA